MRSRFLPLQLAAFLVIALLGVLYVEFEVVGIHVFSRTYHVTVEMADAGGIFPHANVDYRGQQVGTVSTVRLRPGGVALDLEIDPGVQVPDNTRVAVTALSGVGEQYVDLRPDRSTPPYLHDGSVIPASRTTIPLPVATVLVDTEGLVRTIDPADLSAVVDETAAAFGGTGHQLRDLLTGGSEIFQSLRTAAPQTVELEKAASIDLQTADAARGDFTQFSAALAQLTGQLKASDADIRAVIDNGDAVVPGLAQVVRDDSPALAVLLGNTVTFGNIAVTRVPAYKQFLIVFPAFGDKLSSVVSGNTIQARGYINTQTHVCGYSVPMRSPLDTSVRAPILNADCSNVLADELQRGARSAPRPPGDTSATQHAAASAAVAQPAVPAAETAATATAAATGSWSGLLLAGVQ